MLVSCGSKLRWIHVIAKRDTHRKRLDVSKQQREHERCSFLKSLATGFSSNVESILWKETDEGVLATASTRFLMLSGALEARGLRLRVDSCICKEFIIWGYGYMSDVVDTMKEINFLFAHTEYEQLCAQRVKALQDEWGGWFRRELMYDVIQKCRERLKAELCADYLDDRRGFALPHKWERCRPRFDEVQSLNIEPKVKAQYMYLEEGRLKG
ncbi:hypothetical protein GN244_ATG02505 [Phytophthora infestans]|uniref:Uncharacterized protein n=1 Tax=Phytophthora infestans TaxID=4787 RepID=A0A833SS97_PHYIN|nr:hypothetical protein GN244_ATG02505 [Phytophthora infestans]KAF4149919.1 hypothetical protein GN958_ATG00858 [Phytophthora infestans]